MGITLPVIVWDSSAFVAKQEQRDEKNVLFILPASLHITIGWGYGGLRTG